MVHFPNHWIYMYIKNCTIDRRSLSKFSLFHYETHYTLTIWQVLLISVKTKEGYIYNIYIYGLCLQIEWSGVFYPVSLTKYSVQCSVSVTPVCPVPVLLPGREKTLGPGRETPPLARPGIAVVIGSGATQDTDSGTQPVHTEYSGRTQEFGGHRRKGS